MTIKNLLYIILLLLGSGGISGYLVCQTYRVPCGSVGNKIELTVKNSSGASMSNMKVEFVNAPKWIQLTPKHHQLSALPAGKEKALEFGFDVDKSAPINEHATIQFNIVGVSGQEWSKEIAIVVAPPDRVNLFQNYPNPFNPETKIEYTLPGARHVKLVVFDVLGREVETLVDRTEEGGYKSVLFHTTNLPTGVYFYRLQTDDMVKVMKMLVTK